VVAAMAQIQYFHLLHLQAAVPVVVMLLLVMQVALVVVAALQMARVVQARLVKEQMVELLTQLKADQVAVLVQLVVPTAPQAVAHHHQLQVHPLVMQVAAVQVQMQIQLRDLVAVVEE
jgi:hypothetical protein